MPDYCRQQAFNHPASHVVQGIQEFIHVSSFSFSTKDLTNKLCRWNEWITFPLKYRDLPLNAQITFTVWDIDGPRTSAPVGGTTFRMFGKKRLAYFSDDTLTALRHKQHTSAWQASLAALGGSGGGRIGRI
jgi:hypothetical protein